MPTILGMRTDFSIQFGALLKSLRKERKISQQKLAESAGVDRNYIYYLERGDSAPTLGVLMGLARGLGMPFSEFAALIEVLPASPQNPR
jgi:transcriptional regulator with XRE-family HTH domain